jgi:hypothetical protein
MTSTDIPASSISAIVKAQGQSSLSGRRIVCAGTPIV